MKLSAVLESVATDLVKELKWYTEYFEDIQVSIEIVDSKLCFYRNGKLIANWTAGEATEFRLTKLNNFYNISESPTKLLVFFEPIADEDSTTAITYAAQTRKRFPAGEPMIAKNTNNSYHYALNILKKRFLAGEPTIATNALWSFQYARDVINGKFKLGEPMIATNAAWSFLYARDVLKTRFELGEPNIMVSAAWSPKYQDFLNSLK